MDEVAGVVVDILALQVAVFQHPGHGVGDGQEQAFFLEHRIFAADALELAHDVGHVHARAQGQGHEPADGLGLGRDRAAGFADGGEDLEGLAVNLVDREIEFAEARFDLLGEAENDVRPHAHLALGLGLGGCCGAVARAQDLPRFAAVAVDGHALAAEFIGQPVDFPNVFLGGGIGQVDGLGHGVVGVFLEGGLHLEVPDRFDVHGRDEHVP